MTINWTPQPPLHLRREDYRKHLDSLLAAADSQGATATPWIANWGRQDLFFLLCYLLKREDADNDWVFERCREIQASPNGHLDLWAREHYKSTVITYALTIQDILNDPEITVGIFSHTRPIAKAFLKQIKREFETNDGLKALYPDVLFADPVNESPKWSEDEGIIVKRAGNPKESTVEAWGLVDGQPTSKHFKVLVYDDIVVESSVGTPEMINKTTHALSNSYNLGTRNGVRRFIGTRYHFNDTYKVIMDRGTVSPRLYPATANGKVGGRAVFLNDNELADKRRDMGPYVFGAQMLQDPTADELQGFKREWLKYASSKETGLNICILCDPASKKKPTSDYSSYWVVGLGADKNVYVLDMVRDRLRLTERADMLFNLHRYWNHKGAVQAVAYEEYGLQADIEHMQDRMARENYRFDITPVGGRLAKNDRIRRLVPWFEKGRIWLPPILNKTNYEERSVDLVAAFINEEYLSFPVGQHDDMLDALARLAEPELPISWPAAYAVNDDMEEEPRGRNQTTGY